MNATTATQKRTVGTADILRAVFENVQNPENWKLPTTPFITTDKALAGVVCQALVHFTGGVETGRASLKHGDERVIYYEITSKGYYHYIGA